MSLLSFGRKIPKDRKSAVKDDPSEFLDFGELASSLKEMERIPGNHKRVRNLKPRRVLVGDGELDEVVQFLTREDTLVERIVRKLVVEILKEDREESKEG
jgi:hypothetical protein